MIDIEDSNITEIRKVKKNGVKKSYVKAQRHIYSEPFRKLYHVFLQTDADQKWHLASFYKYKPFYITPPTEREKESCLCIKCQNINLLLKGISTYRNLQKLSTHNSATEFLKNINNNDNGKTTEYSHVAKVNKTESASHIVEQLLSKEIIIFVIGHMLTILQPFCQFYDNRLPESILSLIFLRTWH